MRPVLTPLPLLRLVTIVMALLALFFGAQLLWQRHVAEVLIEDRFTDTVLQDQLANGLQELESLLQPGPATDRATVCPPKADQDAATLKLAQSQCVRAALNAKLATASVPQHISMDLTEKQLDADPLKTLGWLQRNARDGNHALALLRNPEQTVAQNSSMPDPFRLSGCLLFANTASGTSADGTSDCPGRSVVTDADLPPHTQNLFFPVQRYRSATRDASPNTLDIEAAPGLSTPLTQGRNLTVTWSMPVQEQVQTTAACYAGDAQACKACKWCNTSRASSMFESARARAIGILVVDVKTGAIEASASAYTPCYSAQQRAEPTPAGCPLFPSISGGTRSDRSFRLDNQGLRQTAMPGSQVKIPIAMGLMKAGLSPRETAALPGILTRSATEELIDIVLCKEQDFSPVCAQRRLSSIKAVALKMGWQSQTDIFTLGQIEDLSSMQFGGRLMQIPLSNGRDHAIPLLDQNAMRQCGLKPVQERWRNCNGANLVNVVAELFGQGSALASPVGIANGLLQLAAAGNGWTLSSSAHLMSAVQDEFGTTHNIQKDLPLAFKPGSSAPVLLGLSRTHTEGTAHSACLAARAAADGMQWAIPCSSKEAGDSKFEKLRVASKTGTPVFSADRLTLPQWRAACAQLANDFTSARKGQPRWYHLRNEVSKCKMSPYKWYSMIVGQPGTQTWDKVIVVVSERNWYHTTQRVDSALDKVDSNVAAEVGLALANQLYAQGGVSNQTLTASHQSTKGQP